MEFSPLKFHVSEVIVRGESHAVKILHQAVAEALPDVAVPVDAQPVGIQDQGQVLVQLEPCLKIHLQGLVLSGEVAPRRCVREKRIGRHHGRIVAAAHIADAHGMPEVLREGDVLQEAHQAPGADHGAVGADDLRAAVRAEGRAVIGEIEHFPVPVGALAHGHALRAVPGVAVIAGGIPAQKPRRHAVLPVFRKKCPVPAGAAHGETPAAGRERAEVRAAEGDFAGEAPAGDRVRVAANAAPPGRAPGGELAGRARVGQQARAANGREVGGHRAQGAFIGRKRPAGAGSGAGPEGIDPGLGKHGIGRHAESVAARRQRQPEKVHLVEAGKALAPRVLIGCRCAHPEGRHVQTLVEFLRDHDGGGILGKQRRTVDKGGHVHRLESHADGGAAAGNAPVKPGVAQLRQGRVSAQRAAARCLPPVGLAHFQLYLAVQGGRRHKAELGTQALHGLKMVAHVRALLAVDVPRVQAEHPVPQGGELRGHRRGRRQQAGKQAEKDHDRTAAPQKGAPGCRAVARRRHGGNSGQNFAAAEPEAPRALAANSRIHKALSAYSTAPRMAIAGTGAEAEGDGIGRRGAFGSACAVQVWDARAARPEPDACREWCRGDTGDASRACIP